MYTSKVTEKGMVTLPVKMRRRLKISRGSKVEFIETEDGILVIPIARIDELFGSDPSMREIVPLVSEGRREEVKHERTE